MKFFRSLLASIGFWSTILKILKLRGAPPPEPPRNPYDNIFINYWHNFREKFDKPILKIWKNCKYSIRIIKKSQFSIAFSTQIAKNSQASRGSAPPPEPPTNAYFLIF